MSDIEKLAFFALGVITCLIGTLIITTLKSSDSATHTTTPQDIASYYKEEDFDV